MNLVKQRIAVAKAYGWTLCSVDNPMGEPKTGPIGVSRGRNHGEVWNELQSLPDYLNNLNAIVEATTTLLTCPSQQLLFYQTLVDILDRNPDGSRRFGACLYWETTNATAAQRVEALLRTLNLWEDDSKGE